MTAHIPDFVIKILRDRFRWVALAILMIIVGSGYGLFLNSKIQDIQSVSFSDRDRVKNQLTAAESRRESLQTTKRTFEQTFTQADLDRINRILPTASEFPELLTLVLAVVETSDLELDAISVSDVVFGALETETPAADQTGAIATIQHLQAKDISISVSRSTGYDQFKEFLSRLESSERLVDAVSINFTEPSGETENKLNFTLRVYLLPDSNVKAPA